MDEGHDTPSTTRIFLVDDHPLFRQALATVVSLADPSVRVDHFETLASVREALDAGSEGLLLLLDLQLPDSHGVAGILALQARFPGLPIAIVSAKDDRGTVSTVRACGAAGFISKAASVADLTAAVRTLIGGGSWFPETASDEGAASLTPTQSRILHGIHRGLMNKQIAHELGLSEATIKYHLSGIFRRLRVQTRSQLAALARERFDD